MKILIVDDQVLVRDGVILLLRRMDPTLQPLVADTCDQAVRLLDDHRDTELVLLDLDLSSLSGFEAIGAIRSCVANIPVVVISANDDFETITRVIQCGAKGFIPKKHSADLMIGALELVVHYRGTYVPASIVANSQLSAMPTRFVEDRTLMTLPRDVGMTPKQAEVLGLLLEGKSNKAIAKSLGVEPGTIKIHISAVLRALNVTSRTQAILRAHELNVQLSV